MRNGLMLIAVWATIACAPSHPPAKPARPAAELSIFELEPMTANHGTLALHWLGRYEQRGARFALIGERGFCGMLELKDVIERECDHCSDTLVAASARELRCSMPVSGAIAVGPIETSPARARIERHDVRPWLARDWTPSVGVDLDGNGSADLERVVRCDHWVRSGCDDSVCDRICTGMRAAGARNSEVRTLACGSFIPDREDCEVLVERVPDNEQPAARSTGMPSCDEYLHVYERCEPKLEPEIAAGNRRSARAERAWIEHLRTTPEAAGLEATCRGLASELERAGCDRKP